MALISAAEYDSLLTAGGDGETVTLGAVTVPCMVAAEDTEELREAGTPVEVTSAPYLVTVRTGALSALAAGAVVTLRGAQYTVDRVQRMRDDALTHFLAYPVTP